MIISEKEIFTYVFFSEKLPKHKIDYIKTHANLFEDEISFLSNILSEAQSKINPQILDTIKDKIKNYSIKKIFRLQKKNNNQKYVNGSLILAADSVRNENILSTETLIDKDSNFIAKVIKNSEGNKVYVFPKENLEFNFIELYILPSGESHKIYENNEQIVIYSNQNVDEIIIKLSPWKNESADFNSWN